uniref:C-type lectin domain-containing protein n=1 Tax=Knipowitschia caucasica TaxID=637954 RepID=A0AAV2LW09_KNICA
MRGIQFGAAEPEGEDVAEIEEVAGMDIIEGQHHNDHVMETEGCLEPVQTTEGVCNEILTDGHQEAKKKTECFALVHCVIVYKYINLKKTWDDAREYCREHHKDLATLENTEEVKKLQIPFGHTAWIGLFDDPASWKQMTSESNSWRWSSTGTTSPGQYQNWNNVQPSGLKEYFRITSLKSWSDSQSYCRQNYQDLATIQTSAENQAVKDLLPSSSSIVWIGLYRVSWRWSDGSPNPDAAVNPTFTLRPERSPPVSVKPSSGDVSTVAAEDQSVSRDPHSSTPEHQQNKEPGSTLLFAGVTLAALVLLLAAVLLIFCRKIKGHMSKELPVSVDDRDDYEVGSGLCQCLSFILSK